MKEMTPMMRQYLSIHEQVPDAILFFRLGDFYEMFFDDAVNVSKELNLVLTGKDCGLDERAPMCGIPFHAADTYIAKLVDKGYKVAICEQLTDPKDAKGIVERGIIRIITAGTKTQDSSLKEDENNYLMCVYYNKLEYGVCYCDITTGETGACIIGGDGADSEFFNLLAAVSPSEIIVNSTLFQSAEIKQKAEAVSKTEMTVLPAGKFNFDRCVETIKAQLNVFSVSATGIEQNDALIKSCGALLEYVDETQKVKLGHITKITLLNRKSIMHLDYSTRKNLELTETISGNTKTGSLLWVLDKTATNIGARMLRKWLTEPLTDKESIVKRHDAVSELKSDLMLIEDLSYYLKRVSDVKRLTSKIGYKTITGKELLALKDTIAQIPNIKKLLANASSELLKQLVSETDELSDIYSLIDEAISEECTNSLKDGNLIRPGYSEQEDEIRALKNDSKSILAQIEAKERAKSGINNMKIKYNKVFGYYFEVTNSNLENVPDYFIRKQTLVNAERFFTEELKDLEIKLLSAQDELIEIESELYEKIVEELLSKVDRIQKTADNIGILDVLNTFAFVSYKNRYVRPKLNDEGRIKILSGRHPVVEQIIGYDNFVPNDIYLDNSTKMAIITGPNMSGKSTYIRQAAIIVLLSQIGCFVPCDEADLCIADRIFTRVGASDDLSGGQSTFMVEMSEVSNILRFATKNSFVILDEVGRGTGTTDGLSIAWSCAEYLENEKTVGCKTLFATHYHEMTDFVNSHSGSVNESADAAQSEDGIVFLHKIKHGYANKSYGIEVAKLAGLPKSVTDRAQEIMNSLEKNKKTQKISAKLPEAEFGSDLLTYAKNDILKEIENLPINEMTPIEVTNFVYKIQSDLKGDKK